MLVAPAPATVPSAQQSFWVRRGRNLNSPSIATLSSIPLVDPHASSARRDRVCQSAHSPGRNPQNAAFALFFAEVQYASAEAVTRLRFRLVNYYAGNTQNHEADLRALSSVDVTVTDPTNESVEIKADAEERRCNRTAAFSLPLAAGTIPLVTASLRRPLTVSLSRLDSQRQLPLLCQR